MAAIARQTLREGPEGVNMEPRMSGGKSGRCEIISVHSFLLKKIPSGTGCTRVELNTRHARPNRATGTGRGSRGWSNVRPQPQGRPPRGQARNALAGGNLVEGED